MQKLKFIGFAGLVALLLSAFGPQPWNEPAVVPSSDVSPFALTLSAGPLATAPSAETF
jgi:hypothetical protein